MAGYVYEEGSEHAAPGYMQQVDPERAARTGVHGWVPKAYATPEHVAMLLERELNRIHYCLEVLHRCVPKYRFLDAQLSNSQYDDHPKRDDAIWRRGDYLRSIREVIGLIILEESRAHMHWNYLNPAERIEHNAPNNWGIDHNADSLLGVVFFGPSEQELGQQYGDQIAELFGVVDWLDHIQPYRSDLARYIERGWLRGTTEQQWPAAQSADTRKRAIIASSMHRHAQGRW